MERTRRLTVVGAMLATLAGSFAMMGAAQADPGPGKGDPSSGIVLLLIDRSGSMHNQGKNCIDENGNAIPATQTIRKWECAVKSAKWTVNSDKQKMRRYFVWAFGTLVFDPTNQQYAWNIDKTGQPIKDGSGQVLPAALRDDLAMDWQDAMDTLNALDVPTQGPTSDDCGTPLAGAYCKAIDALKAYRGLTDFDLTLALKSDGLENATPTGVTCQGVDSVADMNMSYVEGNPLIAELTYTNPDTYIVSADGLYVPSWQSNMLDESVTGTCHTPETAGGQVRKDSGAFRLPAGVPNLVTNINFISEFIATEAKALLAPAAVVDVPPVRVKARASSSTMALAAAATASTDPDLAYFRGVADITGGRLITYGDGATPVPGDVTAPHAIMGDVNDNGCVDVADYNLVAQYYNQKVSAAKPLTYAADLNADAKIDINDYLLMKSNYGAGCATPPPAIPVLQQGIFGFDALANWTSAAPLALVGSPRTEGNFSISAGNTGFRTLNSTKFSTSTSQVVKPYFALDVASPKTVTKPATYGTVTLFVSCPSAGIYNQALGTVNIYQLVNAKFSTFKFPVPANTRAAMKTAHSDWSFMIELNTPAAGYMFDNLRFSL